MHSSLPKSTQKVRLLHPRHRQNKNIFREMTVELAIKLSLSSVLSLAAIASLVRLLPYHFSQQAKLQELRTQVQETEARVMHLREQLSRNFDPQQTKSLMMEYSPRLAPNQSRVFWLDEQGN
jgi:uncharacterized BrkB/YihY/UPF0761 family membrane protein